MYITKTATFIRVHYTKACAGQKIKVNGIIIYQTHIHTHAICDEALIYPLKKKNRLIYYLIYLNNE